MPEYSVEKNFIIHDNQNGSNIKVMEDEDGLGCIVISFRNGNETIRSL